jgi:enhancing lycopene biosynthesis protein 2
LQQHQFKKFQKAAVVLSGSGVYDGSEITEAVSILIALSSYSVQYQCFAPNRDQVEVINHLTGDAVKEKRNALVESARIARGNVQELSKLSVSDFDALILPGGFGAAKNLSTFAKDGPNLTVDADLSKALTEFYNSKRVIGACCISPVILARVFGKHGLNLSCQLTLGKTGGAWPFAGSIGKNTILGFDVIGAASSHGIKHQDADVNQVVVDKKHRIVTTPAFMKEGVTYFEVYAGLNRFVRKIGELVDSN